MTRARDIANLVDANGDIVAGALDNVPPADLVNDTTPQLGGNLDAQSNDISAVNGLTVNGSILVPRYSSASGLSHAKGKAYYDTTEDVLKTSDGQTWQYAGVKPSYTSTFDFLQDNSAVSLHRLNNSLADTGGLYNATNTSVSFDTSSKFGSHAINAVGDGAYLDIPGLPRIYAVSFWAKATGSSTYNGYLVDFRHDDPANQRGYLYTLTNSKTINTGNDTTTYNGIGNIYINGTLLSSGSYTFPINTWVHVAISTTGTSTAQTWDQGLRFGNRSDGTTEGNFGHFDQIRTFNRSLSQSDVTALYNEVEQV